MRPPGEIHHEKGRDRSTLFGACLQQIVKGFRAEFYSNNEAHASKLNVDLPLDRKFSFDILGRLNYAEMDCFVWIESKGYDTPTRLLEHYRSFVANVALAQIHHSRFIGDLFWFVCSAPFGCSLGAKISTAQWIQATLTENANSEDGIVSRDELSSIEKLGFENVAQHVRALILTPELMKTTGLKHFVQPGDNLWAITAKLYGGFVPTAPFFQPYENLFAQINRLPDPNHIEIGQEVEIPFLASPMDEEQELAEPTPA